MKRFLKISGLLIVSLLVVVSGVDTTLDHLSQSKTQSSVTWYNEKGEAAMTYNGDLAYCKVYAKPAPMVQTNLIRPRPVD